MKIRLSLVLFVLALFTAVWGVSVITGQASTEAARTEEIKRAVIAREKDSTKAWRDKNKAFFEGFMADDSTYFGAMNPYLETDPKENFLPKFEQYTEMFKILDTQMYNPHVQVYGDIAILTYNSASTVNMGGRVMNYTGKMTTVYRKQGDTWRVVHGHESVNAGAQ
ncbi:MAG TPA: nuclear transport factor 2 family protein [Pyrinomonadaceae bacterium]|nr:nuclear transport factor 2 family protein [Pyrinomonadaceae bacterium]